LRAFSVRVQFLDESVERNAVVREGSTHSVTDGLE
jgi:hypothetical protein